MKTLVICRIERENDRILLYGEDPRYHVIANLNIEVEIGDEIEYEPDGANFGWFVKVMGPY